MSRATGPGEAPREVADERVPTAREATPTLASTGEAGAASTAAGGPGPAPLATYEDLRYRDVFWATRAYEDGSDRLALRALLPPSGDALLEVGAGFGRLVGEYGGFRHVVLLDASQVHVDAARQQHADDPRVEVVLGDARRLPFPDATFDCVVCVRVVHHFDDARPVLDEVARVLRPGGCLVLEFANKRNLKAIARRVIRGGPSPFTRGPLRYRAFHFDHAPADILDALRADGLRVDATRTASLFRVRAITRAVPPALLLRLERPLQRTLAPLTPGPSVYLRAWKPEQPEAARRRAPRRAEPVRGPGEP